jgi:DNA repair protein RadC
MQTAMHTHNTGAHYGDDVIALALRVLEDRIRTPGHLCNNPHATYDYLRLALGTEEREAFMVLFLDAQNRLLSAEVLFRGSLTETSVYPREVCKAALRQNAAAAILAHNHPSGDARPSAADIAVTATLRDALQLLEVRLLDHFIIAGNTVYSLASSGLMAGGDPADARALPGLPVASIQAARKRKSAKRAA